MSIQTTELSKLARRVSYFALAGLVACSGGGIETSGGGTGGGGDPGGGDPGNGGGGSGGGNNTGNVGAFSAEFDATNPSATGRVEMLRAAVPFPKGYISSLESVGVNGFDTAWMPLQYWPDGSLKIAQAQFTDEFAADETKSYEIVESVTPLTGAFEPNDWVDNSIAGARIGAVVEDAFGVPYTADTELRGRVVQETQLLRVHHHRLYHRAATPTTGMERDFLTSQFYVTEYRDLPFVTVDWILGNDYLGSDNPDDPTDPNMFPLGGIDLDLAEFKIQGVTAVEPYLADLHAIGARESRSGWEHFPVMSDTFICDGQTRRYRFQLRFEDAAAAGDELEKWRSSFDSHLDGPIMPLATIEAWHKSEALGLHGGPIAGSSESVEFAASTYERWLGKDHFGPWGGFGDAKFSWTTGTPRNAPMSPEIAWGIQSRHYGMLRMLEQKAWAQAQRPSHLYGLEVGAAQEIYLLEGVPIRPRGRDLARESLGRREMWANDPFADYRVRVDYRGHGWNAFDYQHFTLDLLFDYWTLTGDAWAHEQLRQHGQSLKGLVRLDDFNTSNLMPARAEGWCMNGFVHVYLATQDESLKTYALRRVNEIVEPNRQKDHPSRIIRIDPYDRRSGLPEGTSMYLTYQLGPVMLGYLAAHRFFEEPLCLKIAEDCVYTIEYAWVYNYDDPAHGVLPDAIRYACAFERDGVPVSPDTWDNDPMYRPHFNANPMGSTSRFLVSGVHMLMLRSEDPEVLERARYQASRLVPDLDDDPGRRSDKWHLAIPQDWLDRYQED